MNLTFKPLTHEDIQDVLEIEQASYPNPWTEAMFVNELKLDVSHFFACIADKKLVAYAGYWLVEQEAQLTNIAVHPDKRKSGIGKKLLEFVLADAGVRKATKIQLEVRRSNIPAQKLYENLGFIANGCRPNYYINEDAILMEKQLNK